jgi:hypothetical protein
MSVLRFIVGKTFRNIGLYFLRKYRNANLSLYKTPHVSITVRTAGLASHQSDRPRSIEIVYTPHIRVTVRSAGAS